MQRATFVCWNVQRASKTTCNAQCATISSVSCARFGSNARNTHGASPAQNTSMQAAERQREAQGAERRQARRRHGPCIVQHATCDVSRNKWAAWPWRANSEREPVAGVDEPVESYDQRRRRHRQRRGGIGGAGGVAEVRKHALDEMGLTCVVVGRRALSLGSLAPCPALRRRNTGYAGATQLPTEQRDAQGGGGHSGGERPDGRQRTRWNRAEHSSSANVDRCERL